MDLKIHEFYIYNNFIVENVSGKMVTGMFWVMFSVACIRIQNEAVVL